MQGETWYATHKPEPNSPIAGPFRGNLAVAAFESKPLIRRHDGDASHPHRRVRRPLARTPAGMWARKRHRCSATLPQALRNNVAYSLSAKDQSEHTHETTVNTCFNFYYGINDPNGGA